MDERLRRLVPLCLLLAAVACAALTTDGFSSIERRDGHWCGPLIDVLHDSAPLLCVSAALTLVVASGGLDLSVGAVAALSGACVGRVLADGETGAGVALGVALIVGLACGAIHGAAIVVLRLPPILATLVLFSAGRGLAELARGKGNPTLDSPAFEHLASVGDFGVSPAWWSGLAATAVVAGVLRFTRFGLELEATGDNAGAARLAGVRVGRTRFFLYLASATAAAWAGLIAAAQTRVVGPASTGQYLELDAWLAVALGGTALRGGRARPWGTLCGALTVQCLTTALLLHEVSSASISMLKALGVLGIVALGSQRWSSGRWLARGRR